MISYATREQVRDELKAESSDTSGDANVDEYRREATERIDRFFPYRFVPVLDTLNLLLQSDAFDRYAGQLLLPRPVLAVSSVTDTDGSTLTLWDGQRSTFEDADLMTDPADSTPYVKLQRMSGGSPISWTGTGLVTIEGYFGYHRDYANAFISSGDTVQDNPLASGATEITVQDADGEDGQAYSPRFSPGQVIRIEDEFYVVEDVDADTEKLTVTPGALGTTEAAHAQNTAIEIFKPETSIVRACRRWASYMHTRRGRFDNYTIDELGATKLPADIPDEVKNILDRYPKWRRVKRL